MFVEIYFVFCALSSLQVANGAATKTNNDLTNVFPGPTQDASNRHKRSLEVPEQCKDQDYCTIKPDNYPQELFNNLVKGKYMELPFQPTAVVTENRRKFEGEKDDCDTFVTFEPVFLVKVKEDDWRTVVQAPEENFVQKLRLEACARVGSSCFTDFAVPLGMKTECFQNLTVIELLVHNDDDTFEKIRVRLPICCSCRYQRIYN